MYYDIFSFLNILFILLYILNEFSCRKLTLNELKSLVSKNISRSWIDGLNTINSTNNYCHICCICIMPETIGKNCGSHTLCKYPADRTGPSCQGYIQIGFSNVEKETILDAHNTLRNFVASGMVDKGYPGPQPSASNMRLLEWNDELALIAERWAAQCILANDICRDLERFPVGQNIAYGNLATNNELSFIKGWFDEVEVFNSSEIDRFKISKFGSTFSSKYTQLVWADTYQLGCARAVFQRSHGAQVIYREHFICNYGPTGNIPFQPVYNRGKPCTACHEGTSCSLQYPALCGDEGIRAKEEQELEMKPKIIYKNIEVKDTHVTNGCSSRTFWSINLLICFIFIRYFIN